MPNSPKLLKVLIQYIALPVTGPQVSLPGFPAPQPRARVGEVADGQLPAGGDVGETVELLVVALGVVVVVAVGHTAVVGPAHPGEHPRLAVADDHRVGLEYGQHLGRAGQLGSEGYRVATNKGGIVFHLFCKI